MLLPGLSPATAQLRAHELLSPFGLFHLASTSTTGAVPTLCNFLHQEPSAFDCVDMNWERPCDRKTPVFYVLCSYRNNCMASNAHPLKFVMAHVQHIGKYTVNVC